MEQALEAAHISPYSISKVHHSSNGLLLRADVHTLFDLYLITIDTRGMTVMIAPSLKTTSYSNLEGLGLRNPASKAQAPSKVALDEHSLEFERLSV